jgi:enterochelin esterase-like enzyme
MNRILKLLIALLILGGQLLAQPQVISGKIERIENFKSAYISARTIDIWLPDSYSTSRKYAVLYMQDGQMLFDSTQTWNKQAWDIDDVATGLLQTHQVRNFIVVGIWNGGKTRHEEYFPERVFQQLSQTEKDTFLAQLKNAGKNIDTFQAKSNNYLQFIVKELKPYIDKRFSVHTNPANTFIAGSSMGALVSIYALCEYPQIFGGAACLSTHWVGAYTLQNNPIPQHFIHYLNQYLPKPTQHKIYFDCGDQTLDALYPGVQQRVDSLLSQKGFTVANGLTRYFPGHNHSEKSWKNRLNIPLVFLLRQ